MLALRATVEGFYGRPWSHAERLDHLAFSGRVGLNAYVYGPKDDPWHRERWREPYPDEELARIAELVSAAEEHGVALVFAIHPGLSMAWDDPVEQDALHAKAAQLWEVGVRRYALFFDDIDTGDDPAATGAAHGRVCARFVEGFLVPRGAAPTAEEPFLMVPTDYAGTQPSPYRTGLGSTLPADTLVFWTGSDVVVGEVTDDDVAAAHAAFGRPLALWDNFPVNDFDASRLFLGPLVDRPTRSDALVGITANPMVQPHASRIALATVAEYARDPTSYDPAAAHARAVAELVPPPLRPLVEVCSSWPPSADPSPRLSGLCAAALHDGGVDALVAALEPLAAMPDDLPGDLARELEPWVRAGRDVARAGIEAARLLGGTGGRAATVAALEAAEAHVASVLRPVIPPFVRAALEAVDGRDVAAYPRLVEHAVPILPSRNLRDTLAFWERLGFENRGAPPEEWDYLIVGRGTILLHFIAEPTVDPLTTAASCYLYVDDADALHAEWAPLVTPDPATGSRLVHPVDSDYGMREFAVVDPSGNLVRVGSQLPVPAN